MTAGGPPSPTNAWRHAHHYAYLKTTGRAGFAWEWLRRTGEYRSAWHARIDHNVDVPHRFGLEAWINPSLPASTARPIWHAAVDPGVLAVTDVFPATALDDALDLLTLATWVSVAIDSDDHEHWLISDGCWSVRVDVVCGTLLGGPFEPQFAVHGIARLRRAIRAMERLRAIVRDKSLPMALQPDGTKTARWIEELRTADALEAGAPTREIAQALFGIEPDTNWRTEHESYRSRTRRLMRTARLRLRQPVVNYWFER